MHAQCVACNWASEASPTLGCSIEISRDICRYVCLSWSKKRRRKYVGQTRACSKSVLGAKILPVTPVLLISTKVYAIAALAWMEEKRSLRNEKLKAKRAT